MSFGQGAAAAAAAWRHQGLASTLLVAYGMRGGASLSIAKFAVGQGVSAPGFAFWQCAGAVPPWRRRA